ncbi:hypothetical protein PHET_02363 [Paragonimus heterotremus]|uniref:WD repeat-containing protein 27 n=1 Tax=Paragonimus heterotremus TaxID=100268 RepID=A0A8J4TQA6_9TREM|nr:hypothetical protein PHET_02363 [Paragonimus heterotremus]
MGSKIKPPLIFLQSYGFALLDVLDDLISVCRYDQPRTVFLGKYEQLPEMSVLFKSSCNIKCLKLISSNPSIRILIATSLEVHLIEVDDIYSHSLLERRPLFSLRVECDDQLKVLVDVDSNMSVLIFTRGTLLNMRSIEVSSLQWSLRIKNPLTETVFIGSHPKEILNLSFLLFRPAHLVSVCEDAIKIWDVNKQGLLHTINNLRVSPSAFCLHPLENCFIYGSKDGQVSLFRSSVILIQVLSVNSSNKLFSTSEICSLQKYSIEFAERLTVPPKSQKPLQPGNGRSQWLKEQRLVPRISIEVSCHVLAIAFITSAIGVNKPKELRSFPLKLVVITCARFCFINVATSQIETIWSWPELGLSDWTYVLEGGVTVTPTSINFWVQNEDRHIGFFSLPCNQIDESPRAILSIHGVQNTEHKLAALSLLASGDLQSDSVLRKTLRRQNNGDHMKSKINKGQFLNKAVSFGHPIKSSGYARQEPPRKMFQPLTKYQHSAHNCNGKKDRGKLSQLTRVYARSETAPCMLNYSGLVDAYSTPIYHLSYSPTGNRLAVALGNGVCLLLRCTSRKDTDQFYCKPLLGLPNGDTLSGHKGPVLCASWSSDGRLLVTGSADRIARMWVVGENVTAKQHKGPKPGPRTTLVMDSINGGSTNCFGVRADLKSDTVKNDKTMKDGSLFPDCIQFAHFHYLDSFVYLVCRNVIRLYSYDLADITNMLDKGHATSLYKLAGNFAINSCNRITAISSVNMFYSYLLISAGSDRRLSVLDLNASRVVKETESAHTRNITAITLNQGSMFSSPTETDDPLSVRSGNISENYSTFATVAPGDCARMWDLRDTTHPVLQFLNPDVTTVSYTSVGASLDPLVPPVNASFSPCGRQLVVGGRLTPNQLYPVIYDTRRPGSHPLATLYPNTNKAPSAPTTVVAWHPLRPEVATGSHEGQLATFVAS